MNLVSPAIVGKIAVEPKPFSEYSVIEFFADDFCLFYKAFGQSCPYDNFTMYLIISFRKNADP